MHPSGPMLAPELSCSRATARGGCLRGAALLDVAIAMAVVAALLAVLVPMLGSGMKRSGMMVSANNLRTLGQGYAAYEASWNGRQFSLIRTEMNNYTGCAQYSGAACPPSLILGADAYGGLWGYWIMGSRPECSGYPGSCGNWNVVVPLPVGGNSATYGLTTTGSCFFPNARGVREYVSSRFYDPLYYSPNDTALYSSLRARQFNDAAEFTLPTDPAQPFDSTLSTYAYSPAALWNPAVLRAPSQGGFQAPGRTTCPQAYTTPTAAQCTYPAAKTRMIERRWCQDPPALLDPAAPTEAYAFNAGRASRPGTLFFDGHVAFVYIAQFELDDATVRAQTGTDGLWSRDTAFGNDGLWGTSSIDGVRSNPNFLTTGGITGRDLINAP